MSRSRQWHSRRSRRVALDLETAGGPTLIMSRHQWEAFVKNPWPGAGSELRGRAVEGVPEKGSEDPNPVQN